MQSTKHIVSFLYLQNSLQPFLERSGSEILSLFQVVGRLYTLRRLRCQQVVCSNLWRAKHLDFKASRSYILHRIMKRLILIAFTLAFASAHPFAQTQTVQLAYRADLTRVVSYMMVSEGTNRTYNHIGVSDSFHPVSHHANDLGRIEKLVKIQTWHMDRFAEFLGKLAEVRDGEGTLLDNSIFLYGSNMSNSDRHNGHPLPTIIVGGGGGKLSGGKHIELPGPTPLANLHLTFSARPVWSRKVSATAPGQSRVSEGRFERKPRRGYGFQAI